MADPVPPSYVIITLKRPVETTYDDPVTGEPVTEPPYKIPAGAFAYRGAITELDLPITTEIEERGFMQCESLTGIYLPEVLIIGDSAFKYCSNAEYIRLPKATNLGNHTFAYCSAAAEITMPKVQMIGYNAFEDCTSATSISIPKAISIGDNAFRGCNKITSFSASKLVTIGFGAFSGCEKITNFFFPNATDVQDEAFNGCKAATSISLPSIRILQHSGQPALGANMFKGCTAVTYINLQGVDIEKIPYGMFTGLTNLKWLNVQSNLFTGSALETFKTTRGIHTTCNIICKDGIAYRSGSSASTFKSSVLNYDSNATVTEIKSGSTVPSNLEDGYATGINANVFQGQTGLSKIFMPRLNRLIGANAFKNCTGLNEARLPLVQQPSGTVTDYGITDGAFSGCTNLKYVELGSLEKATVSSKASAWGLPSGCLIICSDGNVVI